MPMQVRTPPCGYPVSMIDTHCHLDRMDDATDVVASDIAALVTIGTGVESSRTAVAMARAHPKVHAAVGVHPNDATSMLDSATHAAILELARDRHVVAVGETGFDDHWKDETLEAQRESFERHLAIAREVRKPLVLHVRDGAGSAAASEAAIEAVRSATGVLGILHCFSGHGRLLEVGIAHGWYVSFAGNVTYPSAGVIRASVARVPIDRLLVETDAPFLAPVPHRGRRNDPRFVRHVAQCLADELGMAVDDLESRLDANARAIYRLPDR